MFHEHWNFWNKNVLQMFGMIVEKRLMHYSISGPDWISCHLVWEMQYGKKVCDTQADIYGLIYVETNSKEKLLSF